MNYNNVYRYNKYIFILLFSISEEHIFVILIYLNENIYPLTFPIISDFLIHNWSLLYNALSSMLLLSPLVNM